MAGLLEAPVDQLWTQYSPARNLDHYVEAQVHGDVSLERDVEALVADPSFRGTELGEQMEQLASRYNVALHWHQGSVLRVDKVPADFRGPQMPNIAKMVAPSGLLTPALIGRAASTTAATKEGDMIVFSQSDVPGSPKSKVQAVCGTKEQVMQLLKLLWHCLLRHGSSAPELG